MNFDSPEQAVRFAMNIMDRAEYAKTDLSGIRGTSNESITPLERHAQAAMIMNAVDRLPPPERCAVLAMYGRGRGRTDAVRDLAAYLMPVVRKVVPGEQQVQIVIMNWATKRPSIRAIADRMDVSFRQVTNWRGAVLRAWVPLQARAMQRLEDSLFGPSKFGIKE